MVLWNTVQRALRMPPTNLDTSVNLDADEPVWSPGQRCNQPLFPPASHASSLKDTAFLLIRKSYLSIWAAEPYLPQFAALFRWFQSAYSPLPRHRWAACGGGQMSISEWDQSMLVIVGTTVPSSTGTKYRQKKYNCRDSLVVTHPTTNRPACGLNAVNTRVGALAGWWGWCHLNEVVVSMSAVERGGDVWKIHH
jgi:hypothetical protein